MKHRGVVCEKCGVEVIQSKVRRERMGHITLATPVAHIWFLKIAAEPHRQPARADAQGPRARALLRVAHRDRLDGHAAAPRRAALRRAATCSARRSSAPNSFTYGIGAEAIRDILAKIDVENESEQLRTEMKEATSEAKRKKLAKRLKVLDAFRESRQPARVDDARGHPGASRRTCVRSCRSTAAASRRRDLNDLYRRVINRNNRLKRLLELNAPEVIIRNEKRMLQEAVDALFDNGRRGKIITGPNKRPLKSLSRHAEGQAGPLPPEPARQARRLLGPLGHRRRARAAPAPVRPAQQDGARALQAVHLQQARERGYVTTIKAAKKMVEKERPEVWDILDEVIKEHPVHAEPRADAAPSRHPGVRAGADRRQGDPAAPAGVRRRSTPTSTATRWRSTCRSRSRRRSKRAC